MAGEWFRSPAWDDAARCDFEARLARARRHNRQQYLRIKAVALHGAGQMDAARALLLRVIEEPGFAHEDAFACEMLGDIAAQRGETRAAEEYYRRVLADHPTMNGTTGCVEISLAELLLDKRGEPGRGEALSLLDSWLKRPGMKFDNQLFRWHLALIRLAEQTGDRQTVRRAANTALRLASRGPQLPRHKDVGLVRTDSSTLRRLRKLAK